MMSKKLALLLAVGMVQVEAKEIGTTIAQFGLIDQGLPSRAKKFTNKTHNKIKIRWVVVDRETGDFYAQEPLVDKNGSVEMGFPAASSYFGSRAGSGYDISIEVFKVLKTPRQKWDEADVRPFRNGRKDLLISTKTFDENDDFELVVDKGGNLDCKPLLQPKVLNRKRH